MATAPSSLATDSRWRLVQRVAASPLFQRSPKLREFLLYVCENVLTDRLDRVREQQIGCEVFGRRPDYDMSGDSIVRVEARELRRRLAQYFENEGRDEPVVITLPKGRYVPVFVLREAPASPEPTTSDNGSAAGLAGRPTRAVRWTAVWAALAAVFALTSVVLAVLLVRPGARLAPAAGPYDFYSELLGPMADDPEAPTLIVLSNPRVLVFSGASSPVIPGAESGHILPIPPNLAKVLFPALNRGFESLPHHYLRMTEEGYTGMGEAQAAFHIGHVMEAIRRPVRLTQGRFLNWGNARRQHLFILGSPNLSEWTHRNVLTGKFSFVEQGVRNASPEAGEPEIFPVTRDPATGRTLEDYGLIWMSTSPSGSRLLVVAGRTSAGTGGAGEFFGDAQKMRMLYDRMKTGGAGAIPANWQALIHIKVRDGIAVDKTYVTHRLDRGERRPPQEPSARR